jgi:hypothetical protein
MFPFALRSVPALALHLSRAKQQKGRAGACEERGTPRWRVWGQGWPGVCHEACPLPPRSLDESRRRMFHIQKSYRLAVVNYSKDFRGGRFMLRLLHRSKLMQPQNKKSCRCMALRGSRFPRTGGAEIKKSIGYLLLKLIQKRVELIQKVSTKSKHQTQSTTSTTSYDIMGLPRPHRMRLP